MNFSSVEECQSHLVKLADSHKICHAYMINQLPIAYQSTFIEKLESLLQSQYQDIMVAASEPGKSVAVDEVRRLIDRLSRKPVGELHWVIIPYADLLTSASANALLKTLEEPPGQSVFLLMASSIEQVIPTIKSRCQELVFSPQHLLSNDMSSSQRLYRICQTELLFEKENRLVEKLDEIVNSTHYFTALQALKKSDIRHLLQALMQLIAVYSIESPINQQYWIVYKEVLELYKIQSKHSILNPSLVLDRVAFWLKSLKTIQDE
ncbi:hypothetical protein OAT84_01990 [Gammaproteobacteria bacterium]|nr:hypothetical protein [Gammaproteobacteria bacterium]